MHSTKLVKVGNSIGVILPRDILALLRIELGDSISWTENKEGMQVRAHDAAFVEAMTAAETVMREDRDILAVLAK